MIWRSLMLPLSTSWMKRVYDTCTCCGAMKLPWYMRYATRDSRITSTQKASWRKGRPGGTGTLRRGGVPRGEDRFESRPESSEPESRRRMLKSLELLKNAHVGQ